MRSNITYILFALCLIFTSCETEVDMGDIPIESRAVINTTLVAGESKNYIYITESRAVFRPSVDAHWGRDAYKHVTDIDVMLKINDKVEKLEYNFVDSAYLYLNPLNVNDKVELSTSYKGKSIKSVAIVPEQPQILSIDTMTIHKVRSGTIRKFLKYNIKIKDAGSFDRYYRIKVDIASHYQSSFWDEFEYWTYNTRLYSDDVILNNGNPENIDDDDLSVVSFPPNYYGVFNNKLFKGQEYLLSFYIDYPDFINDDEYDKWHMNISLHQLTPDLYKYFSSVQRYRYLQDYQMSEPILIYTNIENGLGIFGALNEVPIISISK